MAQVEKELDTFFERIEALAVGRGISPAEAVHKLPALDLSDKTLRFIIGIWMLKDSPPRPKLEVVRSEEGNAMTKDGSDLQDPYDPRHEVPLEGEVDPEMASVALERLALGSKRIEELIEEWQETPADDVSPYQRERFWRATECIDQVLDLMATDSESPEKED
jgi:hypothetical protein